MLLTAQNLMRLNVYTQRGIRIGRLCGFEFEAESQTILRYIASGGWFFGGKKYIIHRSQVVSIESDRMIVQDLVLKEGVEEVVVKAAPQPEQNAASLSSRE